METDKLAELMRGLLEGGPWIFVKAMFVVGLFVYLMFALIIVRQAHIMNETIQAKHNEMVRLMAWMHFGLTVFVLAVAIIFL